MDEVDTLDDNDEGLEDKLQKIAEAMAAELRKMRPATTPADDNGLADPQDAFACEGCQ